MHTVEYRKPLETLMVTVPDPTYHFAVCADKPPEVVKAIIEPRGEITRRAIFDRILVFDEPRFRLRFPAVVNNDFPERTKLAFKRLAKLIVRSEQQSRSNSDGTGEPGENTSPVPPFKEEELLPAEHSKAGKKTKSGRKTKENALPTKNKPGVEESEDLSGSKGKGTRKPNKQKRSKVFKISEDNGGKASPGLKNLSGATSTKNASGKKAGRSGQVREKPSTGLKKSKRKRNYSLLADSSIDWSVAPVAAKRGAMEHYTKDEILALQKHTRLTYNFKLKSDGHPDISAPQAAVDGPPLPSPAIIRMIEEVAFNKRWRLTDLFAYGDKDKSWRLNPVKVRHMLDTV
ncbi:hypothetical protein RvY_15794 [Ramazzottius varieornatus]|uniref:Uncharacterized protein n=1 Tax=Ramazzottius varieornatus TaxID=947166 RepID=A0A1D1VW55_RAMVA|nr:hypothetical protein RvY_15794 [Ramazzottius varieornatus]